MKMHQTFKIYLRCGRRIFNVSKAALNLVIYNLALNMLLGFDIVYYCGILWRSLYRGILFQAFFVV